MTLEPKNEEDIERIEPVIHFKWEVDLENLLPELSGNETKLVNDTFEVNRTIFEESDLTYLKSNNDFDWDNQNTHMALAATILASVVLIMILGICGCHYHYRRQQRQRIEEQLQLAVARANQSTSNTLEMQPSTSSDNGRIIKLSNYNSSYNPTPNYPPVPNYNPMYCKE